MKKDCNNQITKVSKSVKAALPLLAVLGAANAAPSSRVSLSSARKLKSENVVFVSENPTNRISSHAGKRAFNTFSNQREQKLNKGVATEVANTVDYLKQNGLLASAETRQATTSGDKQAGYKMFASTTATRAHCHTVLGGTYYTPTHVVNPGNCNGTSIYHAAAAANAIPTDITLNTTSINDSATGANATVATATTADADGGDTHTYSLVSDGSSANGDCGATTSDDDNSSFNFSGSTLRTNSSLAAGTYSICVQTDDNNDSVDTFQKGFTITVSDVTPPVVQSITESSGDDATSVDFTVTFNENANNVTADDFTITNVTGDAGGTIDNVAVSVANSVYTVTVGTSGEGTFRLDLNASTNITDDSGNGNGTNGNVATYTSGTAHTVSFTSATTSATAFDTTNGTNLSPSFSFDSSDETLTIGNASHTAGTANGGGGTDVLIAVDTWNMTGVTVSNFETITIPASSGVTMTSAQHELFTTFTDNASQSITVASGSDNFSGDSAIESYSLGASYTGVFTLGAAGQDVTGADSAADTISVAGFTVTGDIVGGTGTDELQITTGGNLAGANSLSGFETLTMTGAVTMTEAQHDGFSTITAAGGSDQITVSTANGDASITANSGVETYVLSSGMTVSFMTTSQNITGSSSDDIFEFTGTISGGTLNASGGTDTLSLPLSADISGATVSSFENLTLASGASATLSAAQLSQFSGTVTASGTETVTISGDGNFSTLNNIENWHVGDDTTNTRTVTIAHTGGYVTDFSSNDAITFNLGTLSYTGSLNGANTNDILQMGNGSSIANAGIDTTNITSLIVDSGASVTMTEAQHDGFTGTVTASGTNQITISAATDGFTANADIETYVLGAANSVTLGTSGGSLTQNITGSSGNDTITLGAATYSSGVLNGAGGTGDTLSVVDSTNFSGVLLGGIENLTLASGATVSIDASQLAGFTGTITAAGSEQLNVSGDGNFTTLANIETYSIGDDSTNTRTITISNADHSVSATTANDAITFDLGTLTFTGTLVGNGTTDDTILLGNGADITGGTLTNIEVLSLESNATVDMTAAQYAAIQAKTITAAGAETINISGDGNVTINSTTVETYDFGDDSTDSRTINLGASNSNSFTANSASDAITFDIATFDFSGSLTGNTDVANTFVSDGANDIASATISGFANLTLENSADLVLTPAQLNGFSGIITAAGTDTLTFSTTGSVTGGNLNAIEEFATGSGGGITVTMAAADVSSKTLTATTPASDGFTITGSTGDQTINGSAGSDNLSGGAGADTIAPGAGTDSMTGGSESDIFSGSSSDLNGDTIVDLASDDSIRLTGIVGLTTSNVRFNGAGTLEIDTDATDFSSVEVSLNLTNSAGNDLSVLAVSDVGGDSLITFEQSNNLPLFNNLDGSSAYTEGGTKQVLDANVTISDVELDALNSSQGNYTGASLTIARNGGANTDDVFSVQDGSQVAVRGSDITNSIGDKFASFSSTSGTLTVTFSGDLSTPTTVLVNEVLQNITYSNGSDDPDAIATFDWVFNDGIANSSGANQSSVIITAVNDAPDDITVSSTTVNQSATGTTTNIATLSANDPDDTPTAFSLVTAGSSGNGLCAGNAGNSSFTISGNNLQSTAALDAGTYQVCLQVSDEDPSSPETYQESFMITIADDVAPTITEVTPVANPTNDATPSVTFSSTEAGTIIMGGSCSTATTTAVVGNNIITLDSDGAGGALGHATFSDCTITVEDADTNQSTPLSLTSFTVDTIAPTLDTGNSLPVDNATNIAVTDSLLLSYDENVLLGVGETITVFNVSNNAVLETFTASSTAAATGSNGGTIAVSAAQITITPGENLPAGTDIAVRYGSSTVIDSAGNLAPAISDSTTYNFVTLPELSIAASPSTITETAVTATFTVSLQDGDGDPFPADGNVTMTTTIDGASTATGGGVDFNLSGTTSGGSFQIDSGQSTNTFTVTSVDDGLTGEAPETVIINISGPSGNAFISNTSSASLTISENELPVISGLPTSLSATEDTESNLDLSAVSFSDGNNSSLTITLTVASGTLSSPLGTSGGVSILGNGTASLTLSGTISSLNNFITNTNAIAVTPVQDDINDIALSMVANDGTTNGNTANSTINVTPVNDNPILISTFTGEFDMTGSGGGTSTFTETDNGITMTVSLDSGTWTNDASGGGSSIGNSIYTGATGPTLTTFNFDRAIDVNSFLHFVNGAADGGTFTFDVTSGTGSNVTETGANVASGVTITPTDWTNVTAFTVINGGGAFNPAFDTLAYTGNLTLPTTLSFTEEIQGNVDLSDFSFADVDDVSITLTLNVTGGTFGTPVDGTGVGSGVTGTLVSPTSITLVGSPADVTTYLDTTSNITFAGDLDVQGTGSGSLTILGNDGESGDIPLTTLSIDITNVNDAPTITGTPITSVNENQTYSFSPVGDDVDGDALSYSATGLPNWANISLLTGAITGTPSFDDAGTTSNIVVSVSDGLLSSSLAPFSITVNNVNNAPVANDDNVSTLEDTSVAFNIIANDIDDEGLLLASSVNIVNQPSKGMVTVLNGVINYAPNENVNGSDSFTYTVKDQSQNTSNIANVFIQITSVNDAPSISGSPLTTIKAGQMYQFVPTSDDIDSENLTFTIQNKPSWGLFDQNVGSLSGGPSDNDIGSYENIVISVTDGELAASLPAFNILVKDGNEAPNANNMQVVINEDEAISIIPDISDNEDDTLTTSIESPAKFGTVELQDNVFIYTPNQDYFGEDTFTYSASDGKKTSNIASVAINVKPVNDLPIAVNDVISLPVTESGVYTINVTNNDTDVEDDVVTLSGADANIGQVELVENNIQLTLLPSINSPITINYRVRDSEKAEANASAIVTLTDGNNNAPIITVPEDVIIDSTGLYTKVDLGAATAVDSSGNPVSVSLVEGRTFFRPGRHEVFWQATDSQGNTSVALQNVVVNPQVSLSKPSVMSEEQTGNVFVHLNGIAPSYPLTVNFSISGSADSNDHNLESGRVIFDKGVVKAIPYTIFADGVNEGDEQIVITLSEQLNLGIQSSTTIDIVERNVAPRITLHALQNDELRTLISKQQSEVVIKATVFDANYQDTVNYTWSSNDGIENVSDTESEFRFIPQALDIGVYTIGLIASDNGEPSLSTSASISLVVVESLPELTTKDTDRDGVADFAEGYQDSDGDGIADYLDAIDACNVLQTSADESSQFLLEGDASLCLKRNLVITNAQSGGAAVATSELIEDSNAKNIGGIYTFEATNLDQMGDVVRIVIPQSIPVPKNAVYRKLIAGEWVNFILNANNEVLSAPGTLGYCPSTRDALWQPGLIEGSFCIQLRIEDGGPNDADGLKNGRVTDPGGVAIPLSDNNFPVANDDFVSVKMGDSIIIDVLANDEDIDGDALTITSADSDFGTVTINDNKLQYQTLPEFFGIANVGYGISDGRDGTDYGKLQLIIRANSAPVVTNLSLETNDTTDIVIHLAENMSDPDGDSVSLLEANAESGSIVIDKAAKTITYKPQKGFVGEDIIMYKVSDELGALAEGTITISVSKTPDVVKPEMPKKKSSGNLSWLLLFVSLLFVARNKK